MIFLRFEFAYYKLFIWSNNEFWKSVFEFVKKNQNSKYIRYLISWTGSLLKKSYRDLFCASYDTFANPTIYNIIRWFAGLMGQTTRWPSVWRSKYFFFIISYRLRALKTLYFHFCNFIKKNKKNKLKGFLQRI